MTKKMAEGSGLEHLNAIPSWDEYFLGFYKQVRSRSKDKHTQVGCILVNRANNIIMTGYNSLPAGINDHMPERYERPEKYHWMAHAEENAVSACAKAGIATDKARIYLQGIPCTTCARIVIGAGIKEVIYDETEWAKWNSPTYDSSVTDRSKQMLWEAKVDVRGVKI